MKVSPTVITSKPSQGEEDKYQNAKLENGGQEIMGRDLSRKSIGTKIRTGLVRFIHPHFDSPTLENMYWKYFSEQKLSFIFRVIIFIFLISLAMLTAQSYQFAQKGSLYPAPVIVSSLVSVLNFILIVLLATKVIGKGKFEKIFPQILWMVIFFELTLLLMFGNEPLAPSDSVGISVMIIYATYTMLPVRLWRCVFLSLTVTASHLLVVGLMSSQGREYLVEQLLCNGLLLLGGNILGFIDFCATDVNQRQAFMETRESLELKVTLEEQDKEQRRLLQSVLPVQLANKIMRDMKTDGTILASGAGFKKIYIEKHDSCSILFADIVGFTEFSGTVTAEKLVVILNDLFANFDKMALKNACERIKILGDCYYCISGISKNDTGHAEHTVEMGLSMVEIIRKVREQTGVKCLDMRVGIHSGKVLAGIIGQRKWQFDVWSNDVTLANKMESSGVPGRVHISSSTYVWVSNTFDVEPGDAHKRSDFCKDKGIVTYLIVGRKDNKIRETTPPDIIPKQIGNANTSQNAPEKDINDTIDETSRVMQQTAKKKHEDALNRMLSDALYDRDVNILEHVQMITLRFKDKRTEDQFLKEKGESGTVSLPCVLIVIIFSFAVEIVILPQSWLHYLTFVLSILLLLAFLFLMSGESLKEVVPLALVQISKKMHESVLIRNMIGVSSVLVVVIAEISDTLACKDGAYTTLTPKGQYCKYPLYFSYVGILTLMAISAMAQLTIVMKFILMLITFILYALMHTLVIPFTYDRYDTIVHGISSGFFPKKFYITIIMLFCFVLLVWHGREMEILGRGLVFWMKEAEKRKEEVHANRLRNEHLMKNILPDEVCRYYLQNKDKEDAGLYSRSYVTVGVMFASIPDFSEFYSEDSVNKGGIECMRVLNEIISDFDEVLMQPQFKSIEKIKTINSTYMVASGLFDREGDKHSETDTWQHLSDLADFAVALKETLDQLNMESFNNFKLKIGISQGPVVAGVIGAKKPHYDIWGNTVNMASRMESTGKCGHIQVLKSTYEILEPRGFDFEQRGFTNVKGKGKVLTFFLLGRKKEK